MSVVSLWCWELGGQRRRSPGWELLWGGLSPQPSPFPRPTLWSRDLSGRSLLLWLAMGPALGCWVGSPKSPLLLPASHAPYSMLGVTAGP